LTNKYLLIEVFTDRKQHAFKNRPSKEFGEDSLGFMVLSIDLAQRRRHRVAPKV